MKKIKKKHTKSRQYKNKCVFHRIKIMLQNSAVWFAQFHRAKQKLTNVTFQILTQNENPTDVFVRPCWP